MGDKKIEILKKEITTSMVNEFNFQIDEVLSMCESEIEKLMLLNLYMYFLKFRENNYSFNSFYGLEFIEQDIMLQDPDATVLENSKNLNRAKKYNYRHVEQGVYSKNIGFKAHHSLGEGYSVENKGNADVPGSPLAGREFEVRPQYPVEIDGTEYRIDIAIILKRTDWNNNILESRKVALECDGYDYHSSPEQKRNDDIRSRKLKKSGWKEVLRYSGKELHSIKSKSEVHALFKEIIEVLYI